MSAASIGAMPIGGANAQSVDLPPIVVQGATLETQKSGTSSKISAGSEIAPSAGQAAATGTGDEGTVEAASGAGEDILGVPRERVGTSVSVVTREELRARQIRHAGDALRGLPGVSVSQQGGPGNLTVVRLRGAESNHTLVMIDGVEANSSVEGFFDFSSLDVEDIDRIEVLRGPQSGIYGGSAVGGVVNIITTSGKGPLRARGRVERGSFGTTDLAAQIAGGTERAHASLTVHRNETDGFNLAPAGGEKDGSELTTFSFKGGFALLDNLKITGGWRQSDLTGDRDGFDGFLNGFNVANDNPSTFTAGVRLGHLRAKLDTLGGDWVHTILVSYNETEKKDDDRGFFPSFSHLIDERTTFGYTTTYKLDTPAAGARHFLTGLVETTDEEFRQRSPSNFETGRSRFSYAGEVRGEYFNTLFLTGTVRHDDNETFDDFTSWRAQASLLVPDTPFRLHSSLGTGIKYPSFAELYGTFFRFTPNPDLKPETSFGWDAGIETTLLGGRALIDVTYYDSTLQDEITEDFSLFPLLRSINLDGTSTRRGVEVAGHYQLTRALRLGAAYTYLDAREPDGTEEIRRAPHSGRLDVSYLFDGGRGQFTLAANYNGVSLDRVFDTTFASSLRELDDYWLVTAAASYKVTEGVELYGRVENLLDQDYQEVFGYETAEIAAYAGIRFSYEEPSTRAWAQDR